ncbi:MAG TPA: DUF6801 domain-containing protein [Nocardioides sp.]|uniref:DUF6801 domain-containing protein n=1 Tax=Nocardioides sp. TaxID=35761 RepID=UPI002CBB10A3|nr:DUF6801 domain-containing protein [Nocardioides sp.]HTW14571.1 DUF6801 domain-containing protein [Nocardioides sp.]
MTTRLTSRIAALGAAAAVGSAALVAVSPSAQAVSGSASYTCGTSLGPQTLTVKTKVPLPKKVRKGTKVGAKKVTLTVVLPEGLTAGLRGLGVTSLSGTAKGAKIKIGATKVRLKGIAFTDQKVPASGTMKIRATGKTAPVKLRKRGAQAVTIPRSFKFSASDQNGGALISNSTCALDKGERAKIGTVKVR